MVIGEMDHSIVFPYPLFTCPVFFFYELKSRGYDLKTIEDKVCRLFHVVEPAEIYSKSRQKARAAARGLFCYWAVRDLGYPPADPARLLGMTGQGVGYAVERGEQIVRGHHYTFIGGLIYLRSSLFALSNFRVSAPQSF